MRVTKYVISGGLAFAESEDMEKLRKYPLKGWHVSSFKFMGYTLKKGNIMDYIYSVDYRSLKSDEAEEYFELFTSSGWTHMTSEGNTHLFRALPGTKPIHSDRDTVVEKHDNLGKSMKWFAISLVFITALLWGGTLISTGALHMTLTIIASILSVLALPLTWTLLAVYNNKWKAEGKIGLTRLMKSLPVLILVLSIILLVVDDSHNSVRIIASMLIGGILFPTAIWVIMSLYHKLSKKN